MKNKIAIFIIASLLFMCARGWCATYYLSQSGADSNTCAGAQVITTPMKTLTEIARCMPSTGDTVLLKRGEEWREQLTIPADGATYSAYGTDADPIINAADLVTTWEVDAGDVWYSALGTTPNVVWIDGSPGSEELTKATLDNPNEWVWDASVALATKLYMYSTTDPDLLTHPGVEASKRNYAVYLMGSNNITLDDLNLKLGRNDLGQSTGTIRGWGGGYTIRNCTIEGSANSGIYLAGTNTAIIRDNIFRYNGYKVLGGTYKAGIELCSGCQNIIIEDNTFTKDRSSIGFGYKGVEDYCVSNLTIRNNMMYPMCYGMGLNNLSGTSIIEYNYLDGVNTGELASSNGIGWQYGTAIVRYNKVFNWISNDAVDGYGILVDNGSSNSEVYNNIVSGCSLINFGIWGGTAAATGVKMYNNTSYGGNAGFNIGTNCTGAIIKNNIIYSGTAENISVAATAMTGFVSDYNLFYPDGAAKFSYNGAKTFSAYQTASGQDSHSIAADPKFVDAVNGDFRLKWSSSCINAGTNLGSDYDDAFDPHDTTWPYDTIDQDFFGPWEIGAFVYRRRLEMAIRTWDQYLKMGIGLDLDMPLYSIVDGNMFRIY